MSEEIYFQGVRFISANEAADIADLSRDYVTRLCRDGSISGRRLGKVWYVEEKGLKEFLIKQEFVKKSRESQLQKQRVREYKRSQGSVYPESAETSKPVTLAAVVMHPTPQW